MQNHGFVRVAGAIPFGKVCGIEFNQNIIISQIKEASSNGSNLIVFPELVITSYTCGDLFLQEKLIEEAALALLEICKSTGGLDILSVLGIPVKNNNKLFNCAAVINKGRILGIIPKSYVPGYKEFYETRWFADEKTSYNKTIKLGGEEVRFGTDFLFQDRNIKNLIVGIEICEDLWVPLPPSSYQALSGATILCNPSASNVLAAKSEYRRELVKSQSAKCIAGYVYVSAGMGESTTDIVFDADAFISENGLVLSESERFLRKSQIVYSDIDIEKLVLERARLNTFGNPIKDFEYIDFESNQGEAEISRTFSKFPFVPSEKDKLDSRCSEIFNIQTAGLAKRLETMVNSKAVLGISGGLDSTLALLVTIKTFKLLGKKLKDIIAVTMPGFGTTEGTNANAKGLCSGLKVTLKEIEIKKLSNIMFEKIGHDPKVHDITYENVQARARTYILMSEANQSGGIVIGTGDLSEIALGWSTYNGDHMSMYNVNSSIPKTLVKFLIQWIALHEFDGEIRKILSAITVQPITPELLPSDGKTIVQKTEEKIGPYELHDFFLYYFVRFGFSPEKILYLAEKTFQDSYETVTIKKWILIFFKRFFSSQWKRDCVPAGVKVGSIDLSPRGSWRMPSEAEAEMFIRGLEKLE